MIVRIETIESILKKTQKLKTCWKYFLKMSSFFEFFFNTFYVNVKLGLEEETELQVQMLIVRYKNFKLRYEE